MNGKRAPCHLPMRIFSKRGSGYRFDVYQSLPLYMLLDISSIIAARRSIIDATIYRCPWPCWCSVSHWSRVSTVVFVWCAFYRNRWLSIVDYALWKNSTVPQNIEIRAGAVLVLPVLTRLEVYRYCMLASSWNIPRLRTARILINRERGCMSAKRICSGFWGHLCVLEDPR